MTPSAWAAASASAICAAMPSAAAVPNAPSFFQQTSQRAPLDVFRGEEELLVGLPELVDGEDVRVIEGRDRAGLLLEAPRPLAIEGEVGGQDFEGDAAAEPPVRGEVDGSHPADADGAENDVG